MVHMGYSQYPAYCVPWCRQIRFGDGHVALDILAHEWVHGIDYHEAGLIYENQSGALAESFADVFGCFVKDEGWSYGKTPYNNFGTDGSDSFRV